MNNFLFIIGSLNTGKGGTMQACMNRSKVFHDNGLAGNIVTFNFNDSYPEIIAELKSQKKISLHTKVYNPYTFFKTEDTKSTSHTAYAEYNNYISENYCVEIGKHLFRIFDKRTGEYRFFIQRNSENSEITQVHEFEQDLLIKKFYFKKKKLSHMSLFNTNRERIADVIYDDAEEPFIYRRFNTVNNSIKEIHLIKKNLLFSSESDFFTFFLEELTSTFKSKCILICDNFRYGKVVANVSNSNTSKYMVMHTNQYTLPGKKGGQIASRYIEIFKEKQKFNGFIFLTPTQLQDAIEDKLIISSQGIVIPNFFIDVEVLPKLEKDKKIIGFIGRLVNGKGIPEMISEISQFLRELENTELHIFGSGELESSISKQIIDIEMQSKIKLQGYINNPNEALQTFDIFVSYSETEAYGLTTLEAMNQEIPVVLRNANYGPKDIINNGVDGFLFSNTDISEGKYIINILLKNPDLAKAIGKNARKKVYNLLDKDELLKKWIDLE